MTATTATETSFIKKHGLVIALSLFGLLFPFTSLTNTIFAYIRQSYATVDPVQLAFIMTLPTLIGMFSALAVGPVSLRVSKKLLCGICAACTFAYTAIIGLVGAAGGPVELLYLGAGIMGVTNGANMVLLTAVLNDYYPPERVATNLSLVMGIYRVFALALPIVGGAIASVNDGANWPATYFFGLLAIPIIVAIFFWMPSDSQAARKARAEQKQDSMAEQTSASAKSTDTEQAEALTERKGIGGIPLASFLLIILFGLFALCGVAFTFNVSTFVITEYQLGTAVEAGLAISFFTVAGILINFSYALWQKVFKRFVAVIGYAFVTASILVMLLFTTHVFFAFLAGALMGAGASLLTPAILAKITEVTPAKVTPVALSLAQGMANIASFGSVVILSALGGIFGGGMHGSLLAGVTLSALTTVFAAVLFGFLKNSAKRA
jgi:MFS family permease